MSHHLDSELSRRDNRLDLTDQYVFRGETGTVFVLDVGGMQIILSAQPREACWGGSRPARFGRRS